ncbi:MAG: acetate kinase [Desulfobacterales bacterium]|jgi:acetate kinase
MNILVINCGSSSLKYQLIDMATETALASGLIERIGEPQGILTHKSLPDTDGETKTVREEPIPDHEAGLRLAQSVMADSATGGAAGAADIQAVGHRVVHGGEAFNASARITPEAMAAIEKTIPLAPLHNPANLTGIRVARELFPDAAQVAVFDTAFHQTMPPHAYHYALPYAYYEEMGVRRYGFHGTSHKYVAAEAAGLLARPLEELKLVTAHLGSGASVCAIDNGRSVDTTMGMTPLGGVIMGTRVGNIDPGVVIYIAQQKGYSVEELDRVLQKESGLRGICGSNDMRDIHARAAEGDQRACLAKDMFIHRIRQYLGAYFFELGKVDALVFTAGIGEHDVLTREKCCQGLEAFGVVLDRAKNQSGRREARMVSAPQSVVKILVIPTNEELEIARQTVEVLNA